MVKTARKSKPRKPAAHKPAKPQGELPFCKADENWFLHRRIVQLPFLHPGQKFSRFGMAVRTGTSGYTHAGIAKWERWETSPPVAAAPILAKAYEVSIEEMEKRIQELELQIARRRRPPNEAAPLDQTLSAK